MKIDTKNVLDKMLQKKIKLIDPASTFIKAFYTRMIMNKRRKQLKKATVKIQRSVRAYLALARKMKKKKAVKII